MQLSNAVKITKVKDHSAAATDAINSDAVDMSGFEGVLFLTSFGTPAVNNTINAATDPASGGSYTDLLATSVVPGASDEDVWLDIYRPIERYIRLEVARGTSSTCESIWAIQYEPRTQPVDNTTTGTIAGEAHVSPIEGTA